MDWDQHRIERQRIRRVSRDRHGDNLHTTDQAGNLLCAGQHVSQGDERQLGDDDAPRNDEREGQQEGRSEKQQR